ncbi:hypothetical protein [Roseibium alexandrii]|uniref:hypothetical protein n=1 Tax=Roseibium alexandrii TaxID=388408 RepID=UPI001430B078|nr:hypothetical protein [Roseibium alexandrii]
MIADSSCAVTTSCGCMIVVGLPAMPFGSSAQRHVGEALIRDAGAPGVVSCA